VETATSTASATTSGGSGGSGGNATATGTGAPSQFTGAAARIGKTNAWVAMVGFGAVGLMLL
jgi:hypothetical protein